jgi:hypothetical protein
MTDRKAGRAVFFPIRYADDFVVLVSGTREQAEQEKTELARYLQKTMKLELSITCPESRFSAKWLGFLRPFLFTFCGALRSSA